MILDDLKAFITDRGIVDSDSIKFDFDSSDGKNVTVLQNSGSQPCDLARRSLIQIIEKNSDLEASRLVCEEIFKAFCPREQFQKVTVINGKVMHIKVIKEPYYLEKDASGRHCYVFNILVTYDM